MRTLIPYASLCLLLACASPKTEETAQDSVATVTDSIPVTEAALPVTEEDDSPSISVPANFPTFDSFSYHEDGLEKQVMDTLAALFEKFNTMELNTLRCLRTETYQVESDYEESTEEVSDTETETWYFEPGTNAIIAYSADFRSAYLDKTTIYLVRNGEVYATYYDAYQKGQETISTKRRGVLSLCPNCGVQLDDPDFNKENPITVLDQDDMFQATSDYASSFSYMLDQNWNGGREFDHAVDHYLTSAEGVTADGHAYTEEVVMDDAVYDHFTQTAD